MPWKECSVMDERLRFVARLLDGEAMSDVCREFGVSRQTGRPDLALQLLDNKRSFTTRAGGI
jgi:hypothetical protein